MSLAVRYEFTYKLSYLGSEIKSGHKKQSLWLTTSAAKSEKTCFGNLSK